MQDFSSEDIKATNSLALSTAVTAWCRNQTMSAVSYCISVLFHSRVKHKDLKLLNKFCLSMSPQSVADLQISYYEQCTPR